jgi:hypothetical protein
VVDASLLHAASAFAGPQVRQSQQPRMLHTLIVITSLAPSPMLTTQTFQNGVLCAKVLKRSAEGLQSAFNANVVGPARLTEPDTAEGDGWTVLRTPAGRTVAQLRCEPHK